MANYGKNGHIDFSRLWGLLYSTGRNKQHLINNGLHTNTVAKLAKNENVTCEVIANICNIVGCQPGDIMEYIPNNETDQTTKRIPRIRESDIMSKEAIKKLVDMIPEKDVDTIYKVLVRFIPEDEPLPDELEAIAEAKADTSETYCMEAINWK